MKLIGDRAFAGCEYLTNVVIEEGVETIEKNAFSTCIRLESINIPSTVVSIGEEILPWISSSIHYNENMVVTIDSVVAYTTALGIEDGVGGLLEGMEAFKQIKVLKSSKVTLYRLSPIRIYSLKCS